ncbi:MAG: tetratricopeptide repeat protein [Acidobacteria bacterium]|nr:tetratricopeptide repeat protein [Acidobacteriota bacterium]
MRTGVKYLIMRIFNRTFALLLPLSLLGSGIARAQSKPLSRAEILGRLAMGESPSNIAHQAKLQGINFTADSSYLELLSLAGGNGILYERISSATPSLQPLSPDSDPPYRLLAKCAEQIHIGASEQAEVACRAAIEEDPKSPWPYMALISSFGSEMLAQDRLEFAKRAVAAAPDSVFAHQLLMTSLPEGEEKQIEYRILIPMLAKQPISERYVGNSYFSGLPRDIFSSGPGPKETFEKKLQTVLEEQGDLAITHLAIAQALSAQGETARAFAEMREAVRLEPDNSAIHEAFSELYSQAGDHDSEIAELREAVRVEPRASSPRLTLAQHLADLGRSTDAISEWKDLIAIHPKEFEPSNQLVDEYLKLKDRSSAIAELHRHLKATASVAKASDHLEERQEESRRLAALLYQNRDFDEANEIYLDLLASDPNNFGIHNDYGIVLLAQNKIQEASGQFKEALRIDPKMPEAHNNLGLCLMRAQKLDEAIAEYRQALEIDPESPHTQTSLGTALGMKGDLDGAMAQFREMIEKNPDDAFAHANLGHAFQLKKDYSAAIRELKKAVELDEEIPVTQNDLAWLYATAPDPKDRNVKEALVHAQIAVSLLSREPNTPPLATAAFLDTLAEALLINGRPVEALANEEKALSLDPNNAEFRTRIEGFRAAAANLSARKR